MKNSLVLPTNSSALPGRDCEVELHGEHAVLGGPLNIKHTKSHALVYFAMGCFWGAERLFWSVNGVHRTVVGYGGGITRNPYYEEVCSGNTGHTELVLIEYSADIVSLWELLTLFWQSHDPTQGMQQGNDIGTQYRSAIYCTTQEQEKVAELSKQQYQESLLLVGLDKKITTEIKTQQHFYFAEQYHQQYLYKNPQGYCGIKGLAVDLGAKP